MHGVNDFVSAKREYDELMFWLGQINHAALQSLVEAELETLTVIRAQRATATAQDSTFNKSYRVDVFHPEAKGSACKELAIRTQLSITLGRYGIAGC